MNNVTPLAQRSRRVRANSVFVGTGPAPLTAMRTIADVEAELDALREADRIARRVNPENAARREALRAELRTLRHAPTLADAIHRQHGQANPLPTPAWVKVCITGAIVLATTALLLHSCGALFP